VVPSQSLARVHLTQDRVIAAELLGCVSCPGPFCYPTLNSSSDQQGAVSIRVFQIVFSTSINLLALANQEIWIVCQIRNSITVLGAAIVRATAYPALILGGMYLTFSHTVCFSVLCLNDCPTRLGVRSTMENTRR
jgi:hypothetical protein